MSALGHCDFALAILKGVVEHDDGTRYFGSLMGYSAHRNRAIELGLIEMVNESERYPLKRERPTALGFVFYETSGLADLPREGRAYCWDWSRVQGAK